MYDYFIIIWEMRYRKRTGRIFMSSTKYGQYILYIFNMVHWKSTTTPIEKSMKLSARENSKPMNGTLKEARK